MTVCFCTLAIHAPYRQRARVLCSSLPTVPWIVLTDEPDDFADLPVRTIRHVPTGPMANDYLRHLPRTGLEYGAAAYHDKRFAILAALQDFDTAIYLDADTRIKNLPPMGAFPPGVAVLPVVEKSIADHLEIWGSWRLPFFEALACHLTNDADILRSARWCHEAAMAFTKDGQESRFFEAWAAGADFLQSREVYSGEGGVIGLAAAIAGWQVDYTTLTAYADSFVHEGGGPKESPIAEDSAYWGGLQAEAAQAPVMDATDLSLNETSITELTRKIEFLTSELERVRKLRAEEKEHHTKEMNALRRERDEVLRQLEAMQSTRAWRLAERFWRMRDDLKAFATRIHRK